MLVIYVAPTGFYKSTVGRNPYPLYGVIQCRGDFSSKDCAKCANNAMREALQSCPNSQVALIWLRACTLQYSTNNFFGELDTNATSMITSASPEDEAASTKGLEFMDRIASAAPKQSLMFKTDELDVGKSSKRYGMAQCRRDITVDLCEGCLKEVLMIFRSKIMDERGWEIYGISCSLWYHDYSFFSDSISKVTENHGTRRLLSGSGAAWIAMLMLVIVL